MKPKISLEGKYGRTFLWQWDVNMRLEMENVPPGTQVDFENYGDENDGALPIMSYEENGAVYADIPNKLLMSPGTLVAYVYLFDESRGYTKLRRNFLIVGRSKPDNYVYTETKVMTYQQLEERIKKLEAGGGGSGSSDDGNNVVEFDSSGGGGSGSGNDDENVVEF